MHHLEMSPALASQSELFAASDVAGDDNVNLDCSNRRSPHSLPCPIWKPWPAREVRGELLRAGWQWCVLETESLKQIT